MLTDSEVSVSRFECVCWAKIYLVVALLLSLSSCATESSMVVPEYYPNIEKMNAGRHIGGPINDVEIEYPKNELENNVVGWVLLVSDVSTDGIPNNVRVVDCHPSRGFLLPALRYHHLSRFAPYDNGNGVVVVIDQYFLIRFDLL